MEEEKEKILKDYELKMKMKNFYLQESSDHFNKISHLCENSLE